jgi:FkbM family methyltransferase
MRTLCRALFWTVARVGRPFGGVRPRRWTHLLAHHAYGPADLTPTAFRWYKDRWGSELLLHPYYALDRSIIAFGDYDTDLHAYLEHAIQPGMICFDVGANIGEMTLHMGRRVRPDGAVHAFEPVATVLERLNRHVQRNQLEGVVRVHPLALSNVNGPLVIRYADASVENQGMASLVNRDEAALDRVSTVETMRLDDFVARHDIRRIDLMKIDIQGAEPLLLEGGAETLRRLQPDLLMEVSSTDLRGLGKTSRDLLQMVEELGYRVYEMRNGRPSRRLRAAQVDVAYDAANVYCTRRGAADAG